MALSRAHTSTKVQELSKIYALFPGGKMPYLGISKTVRKNTEFIRIHTESKVGVLWAKTNPSSRFCGNLYSGFCVILLTNQPTNKWTQVKS